MASAHIAAPATEAAWDAVQRVWEAGRECDGCKYCVKWRERVGDYGSAPAFMPMAECDVLERGDDPADCPGYDPDDDNGANDESD